MVGHARRELEIANLFAANKENDYDGFIGRGVLAMVKVFEDWSKDDPARMQALESVFSFVIHGDLLSPPTNDPDEWEDFEVEGQMVRRNKRNIMYITRDEGKTWFNLRTEQKGICNDYETGKPVEGVEDPNGKTEQAAQDQEGPADAGDSGDGEHAGQPESGQPEGGSTPAKSSEDADTSTGTDAGSVEAGEQHAGVEPESQTDQSKAKAPKKKSQTGEA